MNQARETQQKTMPHEAMIWQMKKVTRTLKAWTASHNFDQPDQVSCKTRHASGWTSDCGTSASLVSSIKVPFFRLNPTISEDEESKLIECQITCKYAQINGSTNGPAQMSPFFQQVFEVQRTNPKPEPQQKTMPPGAMIWHKKSKADKPLKALRTSIMPSNNGIRCSRCSRNQKKIQIGIFGIES